MGLITGDRTVEIDAPIDEVFAIAADIEGAPKWQGSLKKVEVLERDAEGRPEIVQSENDAKVKTVKSRLRFSYDKPHRIEWVQEKGDTKSVRGWWDLEDLGSERDSGHLRPGGRPRPHARDADEGARRGPGARLPARQRRGGAQGRGRGPPAPLDEADGRTRTGGHLFTREVLYQLSYVGGRGGF